MVEAIAVRHAARHQVTVYGSRILCSSGVVEGVKVIALPAPAAKHLGPVALQLAGATHALARGDYDLVHLHGSENAFILPLLRTRYRVVTTNHGPAYEREKWGAPARCAIRAVEGLSVREASAATAVAYSQARELERRYGRRVRFIPNGTDAGDRPDAAAAARLLAEWGVGSGDFWLFAAARVDPTKGCHTLIEAHRLTEGAPPLLIVGDLTQAPGYEDELRRLASASQVRFVPRLNDKATLLGLVAAAALFVFPSTVEAMSMMLLEALATGTPVVASDIPENTDVLPAGVRTFHAGDAQDLARVLRELRVIAPSDLRVEASAAARKVAARHDWNAIADAYEALYREVLGQ